MIHINADPADLNKTYRADVAILADAKLALQALIAAVRDRIGGGKGDSKPEVVTEIQRARDKWLGEWLPVFTDESVPTNGYRVIYDLMQVVDRDKTIALHDAGGSRGYLSPFWVATKPHTYVGMGGMAAMGWSMGACHRRQAGPTGPSGGASAGRCLLWHDRDGSWKPPSAWACRH